MEVAHGELMARERWLEVAHGQGEQHKSELKSRVHDKKGESTLSFSMILVIYYELLVKLSKCIAHQYL